MRKEEIKVQVVLPPGKYWLGDPCYVIRDEDWVPWLEATNYTKEDNLLGEIPGTEHEAVGFRTRFGDGEYPVEREDTSKYSHSRAYWDEVSTCPVDAGMIGFVPFDYEPKPRHEGLVNLFEFSHHTNVVCEEGDIQFYHGDEHRLYRVQTSDDGDYDY
jgi:hypothetical protein